MIELKVSGIVSAASDGGSIAWEGIVKEYGFAIVNGDCMEPYVHSGDLVEFHMTRKAEVGNLVVVRTQDGQALLRRMMKKDGVIIYAMADGMEAGTDKDKILNVYPVDAKRGGRVSIGILP